MNRRRRNAARKRRNETKIALQLYARWLMYHEELIEKQRQFEREASPYKFLGGPADGEVRCMVRPLEEVRVREYIEPDYFNGQS